MLLKTTYSDLMFYDWKTKKVTWIKKFSLTGRTSRRQQQRKNIMNLTIQVLQLVSSYNRTKFFFFTVNGVSQVVSSVLMSRVLQQQSPHQLSPRRKSASSCVQEDVSHVCPDHSIPAPCPQNDRVYTQEIIIMEINQYIHIIQTIPHFNNA